MTLFSRFVLALTLICTTGSAHAAELRVSGPELALMLQAALDGTVIHLDGSSAASSPPASYLRFGPRLGGRTYPFSLPSKEIRIGPGARVRYNIHDINSSPYIAIVSPAGTVPFGPNISVKSSSDALIITLRFEDAGTELEATPEGPLGRLARGVLSDIEVDHTLLQIQLFPDAARSGIAFHPSVVTFSADIQAQGLAGVSRSGTRIDLVDEITSYKSSIRAAVEREVKKQIDAALPTISGELTAGIRRRAQSLGAQVSSVHFDGTDLVITGTPVLR